MILVRYAYSRFVSFGFANSVDFLLLLGWIFNSVVLLRGSYKFYNLVFLVVVFNDFIVGDMFYCLGVMVCVSSFFFVLYTCACMKCLSLFSNDVVLVFGLNFIVVVDVVFEWCVRLLIFCGMFVFLIINNARLAKTFTSCFISCAFVFDALFCIVCVCILVRIVVFWNNESVI